MAAALRDAVSLLKLRIGVAIAASAAAGMAVTQGGRISAAQAAALMVAVLGASGAAGAFNHYYERDIDARMARTRRRPFASGAFAAGPAWLVGFALLLAGSVALAAAANGIAAAGFVLLGAFVYGIVYTVWLKRRSVLNIVVGGLAGSCAVLAGAAAVDPDPQPMPLALALALFLWTPPHFWSLAAARRADYAAAGVPMLPVAVPARVWSWTIFLHTVALAGASLAPAFLGAGPAYLVPAAAGTAWFLWRSWRLVQCPGPEEAMANFRASLVQFGLLVLGAVADAALGRLA